MPARDSKIEEVVSYAQAQLGFKARANRVTSYGQSFGVSGQAWSGAFMQYVLMQAEVLTEPALLDPNSALAEYIKQDRLVSADKIQRGDLIFVHGSRPFESYRVLLALGDGTAIGGMFSARAGEEGDAVISKKVYSTEIVAVARPAYVVKRRLFRTPARDLESSDTKAMTVRVDRLRPGRATKSTRQVQMALAEAVGLTGAEPGFFDANVRAAMRRYEQKIGYVTGDGTPTVRVLRELARETGWKYFRI